MLLTCPRGHRWERPSPAAGKGPDLCPQCKSVPVAVPAAAEGDSATLEPAGPPPQPPNVPEVPGYQVQGILGVGGMGVVYRAWHTRLKRTVALKMVLAGQGADRLRRFRREAEAVARLQHPNVVQVYEVGEAAGQPYLALEYIDGPNLAQRLAGSPLPPRQAAAITVTLALAVQAAHDASVVHRDLKPANVLLTAKGMPKISDFGLAKQLDDDRGQTQSGAVLGTPSYMAPEQALGKSRGVGPLADVYALGAILYEMLTGRPPFKADTPLNTIYQVVGEEVPPPRRLQTQIPLDLETICLKCLEKDPRRRYARADDLAEDLRAFLGGRPVSARPTPWWERGGKWAWRHPAAAALLAVVALGTFTLLAGSLYFTYELRQERNRAVEAQQDAEREEANAREQQLRAEGEEAKANERLELSRRSLYTGQIWRVDGLWRQEPLAALGLLHDANICPPERRDFAWRLYDRVCDCQTTRFAAAGTSAVALSPDGKRMATTGGDGAVRLWDLAAKTEVMVLGHHVGGGSAVAFSRDGKRLASGGADALIRIWDLTGGADPVVLKGHRRHVRAVAFAADGDTLVSCSAFEDPQEKNSDVRMKDGQVFVWDIARREGVPVFTDAVGILCLAVSKDGKTAAAGTTRNQLVYLDVPGRKKTFGPVPTGIGWVQALAISPNGKWLAIGKADHRVHVWDLEGRRQIKDLHGHRGEIESLAFSPDSKTLASGSTDGAVKLWDLEFPRARVAEKTTLRAHLGTVQGLAFLDDGTLASAGYDGAVLWRLPAHLERATLADAKGEGYHAVAVSPDGKSFVTGGRNRAVVLWDVAGGKEVKSISGHSGPVVGVAFAGGQSLTSVGFILNQKEKEVLEWELKTWKLPGGEPGRTFKKPASDLTLLALAPDGQTVAVGQDDGAVTLWDTQGRQLRTLRGAAEPLTVLTFAPDGRTLAVGGAGGGVRLWDPADGAERGAWQAHAGSVGGLAFGADGSTLASAGVEKAKGRVVHDVSVKLWDVAGGTGRLRQTLQRQLDLFDVVALSPDGRTLAAGGQDCTVKLWDTTSGDLRTVLKGHTRRITGLEFTPDGNCLVSAAGVLGDGYWIRQGEVKLWDARPTP